MLNLHQIKLLPLQTEQKVQHWQARAQFFVVASFSKGSSMFHNGAIISQGIVRGCFDASFA